MFQVINSVNTEDVFSVYTRTVIVPYTDNSLELRRALPFETYRNCTQMINRGFPQQDSFFLWSLPSVFSNDRDTSSGANRQNVHQFSCHSDLIRGIILFGCSKQLNIITMSTAGIAQSV